MSKRILVIDDSALILAAAKHALATAGYDVETRTGVEDLVEQGADGFDLILMDVQMPELYGDDVANILRYERDVRSKIYLFSTLPLAELAERTRDAKLDGYISKDLGIDNLVGEVHRILS